MPQKCRKDCDNHIPASLNPREPHPMCRSGAFSDSMSAWAVLSPLAFDLEAARALCIL